MKFCEVTNSRVFQKGLITNINITSLKTGQIAINLDCVETMTTETTMTNITKPRASKQIYFYNLKLVN